MSDEPTKHARKTTTADADQDPGASSEASTDANVTLDLTGLKCPLPVLKARRQLGQMAAGMTLVVTADDPAAPLDFDHFCSTTGHHLADSSAIEGQFVFRIIVGPQQA